jgi:hypothetical protein
MTPAPAAFRRRFAAHNAHAITVAALSLLAAVVLWSLAYFFFALILLGLTTAARGDWADEMPAWIPATALALAGVLVVWGMIDLWLRRYRGATDRPIVGWHLIGEFLLLPVRVSLAVWGNLSAVRRLDAGEIERAWELLREIQSRGRAPLSSLTLIEPDARRLHRLLTALQFTRYIDLHQGGQDWFYTVRSDQAEPLPRLE